MQNNFLSRTSELRQQLESALQDVDQMRTARSRQAEMVESIVRQRDMYRVLLEQAGSAPPNVSQAEKNNVYTKKLKLDEAPCMIWTKCIRLSPRKTAMLKSIVRQRDMYRVLLEQTGSASPNVSQAEKKNVHTKKLTSDEAPCMIWTKCIWLGLDRLRLLNPLWGRGIWTGCY